MPQMTQVVQVEITTSTQEVGRDPRGVGKEGEGEKVSASAGNEEGDDAPYVAVLV